MRYNHAFGVLLAASIVAAFPARAASVTASPAEPWPTQTVGIVGTGFAPSDKVDVALDGAAPQLATAGADGAFGASLTIPLAIAPGSHTITAVGRRRHDTAQTAITVTTPTRQFGFGPAHLGFNPYETVLSPANVGGLTKLWTTTVSSVASGGGTAAVVGSRVYVGTPNGVQALDRATGAIIWRAMSSETVQGTPLVLGHVYVAGMSGAVQALNPATGAMVWSRTLPAGVSGSPAGAAGVVYVTSLDGNLYALQAVTGAILWTFAGGASRGTPAIVDGVVYLGTDSKLYALDAATGRLIWSFAGLSSNAVFLSSPAVANGVVYIASYNNYIYAVRSGDGSLLWSYKTLGYTLQTPAVAYGKVYIFTVDNDNMFAMLALNARTGAVCWRVQVGLVGSPSIANGVVYFTSVGGRGLIAIDAATGAILAYVSSGTTYFGAPAISDGVVYINSLYPTATVVALALKPKGASAATRR